MRIRAAIFDVFGTVVDWRTGVSTVMHRAFAAKGIIHDTDAFADDWRDQYQPAMERIRSGARGYVPLDDLHRENLDIVLAARGLSEIFSDHERDAMNHAWEQLPPWSDSFQGLTTIRNHIPIAPCSNGSIALMTALARFGGLPWDCILGADIALGYKPDPNVYQASCRALRLAPPDVVMVAAHNDDLVAARSAGLRTAFIPRPNEKGPGLGETEPTEDWDFVAADLQALAPMLD